MTEHSETQATNATRRFDVGLRLLDHQLVGRKDELLGKVDNLVLDHRADTGGHLSVTGIVVGAPGLGPRFGGRLERWMLSIWTRLRPEVAPALTVIPLTNVTAIASSVTVDKTGEQLVADGAHLETWLRHYLISRIPGASGGPDRLSGRNLQAQHASSPAHEPPGMRLLTDLLGARVHSINGDDLGEVLDLCTQSPPSRQSPVGPLVADCLLYGRRRTGAEMGYSTQSDQGPWIIAAPMRAWQRQDGLVPLDDVDHIDWDAKTIVLANLGPTMRPMN